jgi:hypothetical protein
MAKGFESTRKVEELLIHRRQFLPGIVPTLTLADYGLECGNRQQRHVQYTPSYTIPSHVPRPRAASAFYNKARVRFLQQTQTKPIAKHGSVSRENFEGASNSNGFRFVNRSCLVSFRES